MLPLWLTKIRDSGRWCQAVRGTSGPVLANGCGHSGGLLRRRWALAAAAGAVQGDGRAAQAGLGPQTEPPPGSCAVVCAGRGGGISGPGNRGKIRASLSPASTELCRERVVLKRVREHGVAAEELSYQQRQHRACARAPGRAEPRCSWPSFHGTRQLGSCRAFTRLCLLAQNILGLQGIPRQFFLQVYETLWRIGETRSGLSLCLPCSVPLQLRGLGLCCFAPRLFGRTLDRFLGPCPAL